MMEIFILTVPHTHRQQHIPLMLMSPLSNPYPEPTFPMTNILGKSTIQPSMILTHSPPCIPIFIPIFFQTCHTCPAPPFLSLRFPCPLLFLTLHSFTLTTHQKHHPLISIISFTCMGTVHACHPPSLHHHLLSLYPCPHHHSDLSAREPSLVAREWATAKQLFIPHEPRRSRLWGSAPLPRFRAPPSMPATAARAPSSSTASAAWSTAPSAKTPIFWCRGLEIHVSSPSQRRPRSRHPFPLLYVAVGGGLV